MLERFIDINVVSHSPCFRLGTLAAKRPKKSTKEIGDMGFGAEEILLGGRLFPILETSVTNQFEVYQ